MIMARRGFFTRLFGALGLAMAPRAAQLDAGSCNGNLQALNRDEGPMAALGYLSRLLPSDYVFCPPPMKLAEDITAHVNNQIDQLTCQLAGCGVAADGGTQECTVATRDMWGWSPAYQSVLDLRRKYEAAVRLISQLTPKGSQVSIFPCGCWLEINDTSSSRTYCAGHGSKAGMATGLDTNRRTLIQGIRIV